MDMSTALSTGAYAVARRSSEAGVLRGMDSRLRGEGTCAHFCFEECGFCVGAFLDSRLRGNDGKGAGGRVRPLCFEERWFWVGVFLDSRLRGNDGKGAGVRKKGAGVMITQVAST